jgi:hypothetical protein
MIEPVFFYEGVIDSLGVPSYMRDLAGFHSFKMYYSDISDEHRRVVDAAHLWCKEQGMRFERMSSRIFIPCDDNAMAFRLRWC